MWVSPERGIWKESIAVVLGLFANPRCIINAVRSAFASSGRRPPCVVMGLPWFKGTWKGEGRCMLGLCSVPSRLCTGISVGNL